MSDPAIKIDGLVKSYGAQQVLHNVSLSIPAGQTCALLGRNGAGKTTTIRILLGLIPADAGRVALAGIDPATDPLKARSQVGYLAEDQVMYGWMTPIELCRFLAPFYPSWDMNWAITNLDRGSPGSASGFGIESGCGQSPQNPKHGSDHRRGRLGGNRQGVPTTPQGRSESTVRCCRKRLQRLNDSVVWQHSRTPERQ